jgi:hypothetical protein
MNTETADEALERYREAFNKWATENDVSFDIYKQNKYWDCWLDGFTKGLEETFLYKQILPAATVL